MSLSIVHKNKEKKHLNILLKTYITKIKRKRQRIDIFRSMLYKNK